MDIHSAVLNTKSMIRLLDINLHWLWHRSRPTIRKAFCSNVLYTVQYVVGRAEYILRKALSSTNHLCIFIPVFKYFVWCGFWALHDHRAPDYYYILAANLQKQLQRPNAREMFNLRGLLLELAGLQLRMESVNPVQYIFEVKSDAD